LRATEAFQVQWHQIDFRNHEIRLATQKNKTALSAPIGLAHDILCETPEKERVGHLVCYYDRQLQKRRPVTRLNKTWKTIKKNTNLILTNWKTSSKNSSSEIQLIPENLRYHDLRHKFCTRVYLEFGFQEGMMLSRHTHTRALAFYVHLNRAQVIKQARERLQNEL
jgi:integrase